MDKKQKIARLQEISGSLKKDFIGIDEIIDQIIDTITPWYVTPELIERPVVVSIWGLTGTGKTSVIRRLVKELNLLDETLFFDCGAEENTDDSISNKISSFFSSNGGNDSKLEDSSLHGIFVFDEFQFSRTLDEDGREVSKASQRSIWNLLDSGLIDVVFRHYEVKDLMIFTEELEYLVEDIGRELQISKNIWPESVIPKIRETLDFYNCSCWEPGETTDNSEKSKQVLSKEKQETIVSRLNSVKRGLGYEKVQELNNAGTIGEVVDILKGILKIISAPRCVNCSKSLIFVIGNLDEAFSGVTDTDPDMDADVFAKITRKTGIIDVKEALKTRFRAEQIGRLGNSMIIYPSLRKSDFKEIINQELQRITNKFKGISGITVSFGQKFKDLLYSEGVYPSQGVRPVFTTIGTICLPKLSKILSDPEAPEKSVYIDSEGDFRSPEVKVIMKYDTGKIIELTEKLDLGELRSSSSCKKLAAHAIHEAGHAILMAHQKGRMPEMILAQSSTGGGYTYDNLDDPDKVSTMCKEEIAIEIRINLAGNAAEHLLFEDRYCTVGCTQDWEASWDMLTKAVYRGSLFGDVWPWMSKGSPEGLPNGRIDEGAGANSPVITKMEDYLKDRYSETTNILKENKELLLEVARYLVQNRCMFTDDFEGFVKKYGKNMPEFGVISENYWLDKIKEEGS